MKGRITMGIGRRPLGRLRRLTPDKDTHSKGVLANRSVPRGILEAAVPFSYKSEGKCAILVGRFSVLQAPLHIFMPGGVKILLTLFTSESVPSAQWLSAPLAGLAINVSRISPDQTAPNPRVCRAISTFWKSPMFHNAQP